MSDLIPFAHTLADAAAVVTTRYFGAPMAATTKADKSPVTLADTDAERAMRALIQSVHPTHGIWGEEGERVNAQSPIQWVLDPIDGTRAFIAGFPTFTTLIACTEHSTPILGMIDQPILKQRFVGEKGKTSTCNGEALTVSNVTDIEQARVATTSTYYFDATQRTWFDRIAKRTKSYVLGGDAYAYAMLASGRLDAVVDVGLKWYDLAALVPIVEGADGVLHITQHGETYNVIAASTQGLLDAFIAT